MGSAKRREQEIEALKLKKLMQYKRHRHLCFLFHMTMEEMIDHNESYFHKPWVKFCRALNTTIYYDGKTKIRKEGIDYVNCYRKNQ